VAELAGGDQAAVAEPTDAGGQPKFVGPNETIAIIPVRDLPAGVDPSEYSAAPGASAPRGKLRRRLRYLRRVRDLLLRDLGGFTFEIHRTARGTPTDSHRRLVESKLSRIEALDTEVRALEGRLGLPHEAALLREPGIGGTCPECGELHSSDAHYCAHCGAPLDAKARARREAAVAAAVQETTSGKPAAESAPAGVLWAAGPRPGGAASAPVPDEQPSEITSRWLAGPRRPEASAAAPAPVEAQPVVGGPRPEVAAEAAVADEKPVGSESKPAADESAAATPDEGAGDEGATEQMATSERAADEVAAEEGTSGERASGDESARGEGHDFAPAPNGRRADDVPAPDPLPSRPERGA
jgi:hypothetical protein